MKTKEEVEAARLREARSQALGIKILLALVALVGALFLGLFSKNKFVRLLSAICLIAIGIGVAVYYTDEMSDVSGETGKTTMVNEQIIEGSKYNWPQKCTEHFGPVFKTIREAFSEFGGFELVQQPIEDIPFKGEYDTCQRDVPLRTPYRYFRNAELEFLHGALIKYTLRADFDKSYSNGSIKREFEAMKGSISDKFMKLASLDTQIEYRKEDNGMRINYGVENAVLIDRTIMTRSLAEWIEKECGLAYEEQHAGKSADRIGLDRLGLHE